MNLVWIARVQFTENTPFLLVGSQVVIVYHANQSTTCWQNQDQLAHILAQIRIDMKQQW